MSSIDNKKKISSDSSALSKEEEIKKLREENDELRIQLALLQERRRLRLLREMNQDSVQ